MLNFGSSRSGYRIPYRFPVYLLKTAGTLLPKEYAHCSSDPPNKFDLVDCELLTVFKLFARSLFKKSDKKLFIYITQLTNPIPKI